MGVFLKRKIDTFLYDWKNNSDRKPLIVKGCRQIGKTESIRHFASDFYDNVVEINFALQKEYQDIFDDGFDVDTIVRNISFKNPNMKFEANETLIFFDELQACPNAATSLKSFKIDGRYDVICSGSLMGIHYKEIESNSVGYKQDYVMYSLDFEEFLWAKGYNENHIEDMYSYMADYRPIPGAMYSPLLECFREYMVIGGMPEIVATFITNNNYSGILEMQNQLHMDFEEDITKYTEGLDKAKVLNFYRNIPTFLAKENKKYQISKISKNARNRDYIGIIEWLSDAGIVNVCYCMDDPELPLKGNYKPNDYKVYYADTGLLIASLDNEAQTDLRHNKNFNTYKGAIYENVIAEILVKQGYQLYFYKNEKGTIEIDFFVRDADTLIPVEVKASNDSTPSLNKMIKEDKYADVKYGIKFANANIGYNGLIYTYPYFMAFMLKRLLADRIKER